MNSRHIPGLACVELKLRNIQTRSRRERRLTVFRFAPNLMSVWERMNKVVDLTVTSFALLKLISLFHNKETTLLLLQFERVISSEVSSSLSLGHFTSVTVWPHTDYSPRGFVTTSDWCPSKQSTLLVFTLEVHTMSEVKVKGDRYLLGDRPFTQRAAAHSNCLCWSLNTLELCSRSGAVRLPVCNNLTRVITHCHPTITVQWPTILNGSFGFASPCD